MDDITTCPECFSDAYVERRAVLESTDGPIEHAKVHCVRGHWFFLPVEMLARLRPARSHRIQPFTRAAPPER